VVEPGAELHEALVTPAVPGLDAADRRPPAHAVEEAVGLEDGPEAEEAEQLRVKGQAGVEVAYGEHDVGDAVDFEASRPGHGATATFRDTSCTRLESSDRAPRERR